MLYESEEKKMLVSTKGRYALRVMIDLAKRDPSEFITLNVIAEEEEISEKYLESIISVLSKAGFVEGVRGKGGGYRLTKSADEYTAGDIIQLMEGGVSPVACLENGAKICDRAEKCATLPMWKELDKIICDYLNSVKLSDLASEKNKNAK